jgi:hypothetical protein
MPHEKRGKNMIYSNFSKWLISSIYISISVFCLNTYCETVTLVNKTNEFLGSTYEHRYSQDEANKDGMKYIMQYFNKNNTIEKMEIFHTDQYVKKESIYKSIVNYNPNGNPFTCDFFYTNQYSTNVPFTQCTKYFDHNKITKYIYQYKTTIPKDFSFSKKIDYFNSKEKKFKTEVFYVKSHIQSTGVYQETHFYSENNVLLRSIVYLTNLYQSNSGIKQIMFHFKNGQNYKNEITFEENYIENFKNIKYIIYINSDDDIYQLEVFENGKIVKKITNITEIPEFLKGYKRYINDFK